MVPAKIRNYLESHDAKYATVSHTLAFTAQEIAATAHIPGIEMAKTVIVKLDGRMAMAVVPAPKRISLIRLKEATGAQQVVLASEQEFKSAFPDCEPGAMPPLGELYAMEVWASPALRKDPVIAFNAGSHTDLIQMPESDFERLAHPHFAEISN